MRAPKLRPYSTGVTHPHTTVPDAQLRALDRRHALDQQQREFSSTEPHPYPSIRHRPPG